MAWPEFDDAQHGVAQVSLQGFFLRANRRYCEMLGYSEGELLALRVRDVTHPEDHPQSVVIVDHSLRHYEEPVEVIKRYLHKDGSVVWGLLRTTLMRDAAGEPTHFLSFIEDVSARMREEPLARSLGRRFQEVQEDERQRIARELHGELGQVLSALKLELGWLQEKVPPEAAARVAGLSEVVDRAMAGVRHLWLGLRPSILDDLGLEAAIDWLLREICGRNGIAWTFEKPEATVGFGTDIKVALFRICQEALTNIARHARASRVRVSLRQLEHEVQLEIADNGVGLETPRPGTMGLLGIRDRVSMLGGSARLETEGGTTLSVVLPLFAVSRDERAVPPYWD